MRIWERRSVWVIGASLVALVILFYGGINKTWMISNELNFFESNLENLSEVESQYAQILNDNNQYDVLFADTEQENNAQNLASSVGALAKLHQLKIMSFERIDTLQNGEYIIDTYKINLEGYYKDILKAIKILEDKKSNAALVSVGFALEEERRTRSKMLVASLHFRLIRRQ